MIVLVTYTRGVAILYRHSKEIRGVEVEAFAGPLAKGLVGGVVEGEAGLEVGAGVGVFDAGDAFGELEAFGLGAPGVEEALEAAAEVGGAGEIGFGVGISAEEGEDAGEFGQSREGWGGVGWVEGEGVGEHGSTRAFSLLVSTGKMREVRLLLGTKPRREWFLRKHRKRKCSRASLTFLRQRRREASRGFPLRWALR